MNPLKAAAIIVFMAAPAAATSLTETCGNMGRWAEAVMTARQDGHDMSDVIRITTKNVQPIIQVMFTKIIIEAYKVPVSTDSANREAAIAYFSDATVRACFVSFGDVL